MSEPRLQQLEREVELARAKLARDLTTLRSPETLSEFGAELKSAVAEAKDAAIENARSSAQSTLSSVLADLKARAAGNPGAVMAIGAGIMWQLIRRPPITTALIGIGLYSLMRTPPEETRETQRRTLNTIGTMKEKAESWSTSAQEAASTVREAAGTVMDRFTEARDSATDVASTLGAEATTGLQNASSAVQRAAADEDVRDKLLLGAAALSVAAAVGISLQRRATDERQMS